ncbi:MAG: CpsB/CapC family capsule biosynthesis tyrosine phosphatase [Candidatus Dechloromonas phosphoritropha]
MIDLHCHLLPGIDDGAPDLETSLEMARIAFADGIRTLACTPHIYPGVYENTGDGIRQAVAALQKTLDEAEIALKLVVGADIHVDPDLLLKLRGGEAPTLGGTRYFLLEPPHHVALPRIADFVFNLVAAGYTPLITHPERLTWIKDHYPTICGLVDQGAWLQVTSGSLTGRFGPQAKYWGERLLGEGRVHILATDAHGTRRRPPLLAEGQLAAERLVGKEDAWHLVNTRPIGILDNLAPSAMPALPNASAKWRADGSARRQGLLARLFGGNKPR